MFKKYRLIQVPAQNVNTANDKPIFYLQLNHAKNISVQNQIRGHNIRQKSYNPTASTGFDTEKQVEKTPNKVNVNNINHGSTIPHESGRTASNHESLKKGSRTSSPWPPPPSPPSQGQISGRGTPPEDRPRPIQEALNSSINRLNNLPSLNVSNNELVSEKVNNDEELAKQLQEIEQHKAELELEKKNADHDRDQHLQQLHNQILQANDNHAQELSDIQRERERRLQAQHELNQRQQQEIESVNIARNMQNQQILEHNQNVYDQLIRQDYNTFLQNQQALREEYLDAQQRLQNSYDQIEAQRNISNFNTAALRNENAQELERLRQAHENDLQQVRQLYDNELSSLEQEHRRRQTELTRELNQRNREEARINTDNPMNQSISNVRRQQQEQYQAQLPRVKKEEPQTADISSSGPIRLRDNRRDQRNRRNPVSNTIPSLVNPSVPEQDPSSGQTNVRPHRLQGFRNFVQHLLNRRRELNLPPLRSSRQREQDKIQQNQVATNNDNLVDDDEPIEFAPRITSTPIPAPIPEPSLNNESTLTAPLHQDVDANHNSIATEHTIRADQSNPALENQDPTRDPLRETTVASDATTREIVIPQPDQGQDNINNNNDDTMNSSRTETILGNDTMRSNPVSVDDSNVMDNNDISLHSGDFKQTERMDESNIGSKKRLRLNESQSVSPSTSRKKVHIDPEFLNEHNDGDNIPYSHADPEPVLMPTAGMANVDNRPFIRSLSNSNVPISNDIRRRLNLPVQDMTPIEENVFEETDNNLNDDDDFMEGSGISRLQNTVRNVIMRQQIERLNKMLL